jgi:hypothetical protein
MAKSGAVSNIAPSKKVERMDASRMHVEIVRAETVKISDDGSGDVSSFFFFLLIIVFFVTTRIVIGKLCSEEVFFVVRLTRYQVQIWYVEKVKRGQEAQMTPLPKDQYGLFFSKNSYIILYSYGTSSEKSHFIYFWQVRDIFQKEKGYSNLFAFVLIGR